MSLRWTKKGKVRFDGINITYYSSIASTTEIVRVVRDCMVMIITHTKTKQKNLTPFEWCNACDADFHKLKSKFMSAPTPAYSKFHSNASLQTDASATELGAVLEQDSHVIAYARTPLFFSYLTH